MAIVPTHELEGRGTSVLVHHNRLSPNRIAVREVTDPCDFIAVNILKDDGSEPRFYVPGIIVAAPTVIKQDNHGKAAFVIHHLVAIPAATAMAGTVARSAPFAIVRVVVPIVPVVVTVGPIASIRPVPVAIVSIRSTGVTVGSPIVAIVPIITMVYVIVVSLIVGVAPTIIRWMSGIVATMGPGR
jgi:hypothetical protein